MFRALAFALMLTAAASTATAEEVTREGAEALQWNAKMNCGTTEPDVVRYGYWEGRLCGRVPGERDRLLFNVIGRNTRTCARMTDHVRGEGFRSVSRETMVYLDPVTGDLQDYVGGQYHAMEIFNIFYRTGDFMDAKKRRISDSRLSKLVDGRYPLYRNPPPTDDARPNEATWTVFRKAIEERRRNWDAAARGPTET